MTTMKRFGVIFIVAFALLGGLMPMAHAENVVAPTFAPPSGQTHLKGGDVVTFGGTATEGATVQAAYLSMTDAGGAELRQESVKNQLSFDSGVFSGTWQTVHIPSATTEIVLVVTVLHADGSEQTGSSPALPVDQVSPRIEHVEAIAPDEIRVIFSEPVLSPSGNQALDWRINDLIPQAVTGNQTGDIRYLQLLSAIDEDDRPYVEYVPRALLGVGSQPYRDGAGNTLTAQNNFSFATDAIAPIEPVIASIDGKAPVDGKVLSKSTGPSVVIEDATPSHTVKLYLESNGIEGLQEQDGDAVADTLLGAETAGDEGVTFAVAGGTFAEGIEARLYTIASDNADTPNLSPIHSVAYTVDLTAPTVTGVEAAGNLVTVTFTEPLVSGRDLPLDWTLDSNGAAVDPVVLSVTGEGDTRVLQTADDVPADTSVSYTAPAEDAYADAAGNSLASFIMVATPGLLAELVDATPETDEVGVAKPHRISVLVTDQTAQAVGGIRVGFRAVNGPTASSDYDSNGSTPLGVIGGCYTQSDGTCFVEYSSLELGTDEIQTWIDTDRDLSTVEHPGPATKDAPIGAQDVVEVVWSAKDAELQLEASPETASERLVSKRTVDLLVTAAPTSDLFPPVTGDSGKVKGVNVDLRAVTAGSERHLGECFTGADGTCSVTFNGEKAGTDSIQAWLDRNFNDVVDEDDDLIDELGVEMRNADGFLVVDDPAQDVVEVAWSLGLRSVSLKAPRITTFGRSVTLSGMVGGDSACKSTSVKIVRQVAGKAPSTLKTVKSNSKGTWSYRFKPRSTATYTAAIQPGSICAAATSGDVKHKVRTAIGAAVKDRSLAQGQRMVITGKVSPSKAGRVVDLLMKSGRTWKIVRRDRLNRKSRFVFTGNFTSPGERRFKVRYVGDRYTEPARSRTIKVTVARQRI